LEQGSYDLEFELPGRAKDRIIGLNVTRDLNLKAWTDNYEGRQPGDARLSTPSSYSMTQT
jgi:hypothetical protein